MSSIKQLVDDTKRMRRMLNSTKESLIHQIPPDSHQGMTNITEDIYQVIFDLTFKKNKEKKRKKVQLHLYIHMKGGFIEFIHGLTPLPKNLTSLVRLGLLKL